MSPISLLSRQLRFITLILANILFGAGVGETIAQTPPRITRTEIIDGKISLSWTGDAESYAVQSTTNLAAPNWIAATPTTETNWSIALSGNSIFFRVVATSSSGDGIAEDPARLQLLEQISQKIASLPGKDPAADNQAMATFLSQFPELSDISIGKDSSVWAEFPDGRLLTIINNRRVTEDAAALPSSAAKTSGPSIAVENARIAEVGGPKLAALRQTGASRPSGIPESIKAYLFAGPHITNASSEVSGWLATNGYAVVNGDATLNALAAVTNAGVFYYEGHGAKRETPAGKKKYVLVTMNTTQQPLPKQFQKDVGYAIIAPRTNRIFYAITDDFIKKYMTFGKKSFAFVNACSSFDPDMVLAFRDSVYAGWDFRVDDHDAWRTARFLFDRLLGANRNADYQETPPQRPFDYLAIQADMQSRFPRVDESFTSGFPEMDVTLSHLLISRGNADDFGLLAPSIERMFVNEEKAELHIFGIFDPETPAEVVISAGNKFDIKNATPVSGTEIVVPLPATQEPSAGRITIIQNEHQSNTVPLSEWRVKVKLSKYFSIGQSEPSSTLEFNLHFRADVHDSRRAPHQAPAFIGTSAQAARDSTGRLVSASGIYHDPNGIRTVEWSLPDQLDLPIAYDNTQPVRSSGSISFMPDGTIYLIASGFAKDAMTVTETTSGEPFVYPFEPGTRIFSGSGKNGTMDRTTFAIQGGQGSVAGDSGIATWETAEASFPPDESSPGFAE